MRYPTNPNQYHTIYLKWPETIPRKCPLCGSSIERIYKDNGRIVRTLHGKINQITWKYICTNPDCYLHSNPFNPHPRFEFESFYFGRDVVQKVAYYGYGLKEGFKPAHIVSLFKGEYHLQISESTIRRMLKMITVVKSAAIDERTLEIIKKQGFILLGFDWEDPQCDGPVLWCFLDLMSNRVLRTEYLDSAPAERLRDEINLIKGRYDVEIRGVISDKQRNIISCMRRYFPEIPHQFCSFYFAQNLWNHLELKDGALFKTLSKMLKQSYFVNLTPSQEGFFEEHGKLKPREVFEPIIRAIKRMRRIRTKKFETLRVLQLFVEIDNYCAEMYAATI